MSNSCCEKVNILRERIEETEKKLGEAINCLTQILADGGESDTVTIETMLDKLEDVAFKNDVELPYNMVCQCQKRNK